MADKLGNYFENTQHHMAKLVDFLAYEQEAATKRSMIVEELLKISGLGETEVLRAANIIISDPMKTDLFFTLPDNLKKPWIDMILHV